MKITSLIDSIKANKWKQLGLLLLLQGLLMLIGFNKIITSPEEKAFLDEWDGVKNYYTYVWYVQQPDTVPYAEFTGMNYPYNDFIHYVDNTPIIAVAVRWVHLNVIDLDGYIMAIYHWVMFLGMWLSTVLLFLILRKLGLPSLWVFIGSLCLVWLHPQILKLSFGCYNLAFTWTLLGLFYGMLQLHGHLLTNNPRKALAWGGMLTLIVIVSAFCHLYYLALLLLWLGLYLGCIVLYQLSQRKLPWLTMGVGIMVAGISIAICYGMVILTDDYYDHRLTLNAGYGARGWVLNFKDMFIAYWFNTFQFVYQAEYSGSNEGHSYMGSGALYGWLALVTWAVWRGIKHKQWPKWRPLSSMVVFWLCIGIGAILMMFIGLSEHIETSKDHYITNYFNLFFYLRPFTDVVTQFRALGRFVWPLFWVVNLLLLWVLAHKRASIPSILPAIVLVLMLIDTVDMVKYYNGFYRTNPFAESQLQQVREEHKAIDATKYQAILPIPYYHVGSDNYDITVDPDKYWARQSMQFSMAWKLPLMATQLARTAEYQAINLLGLFQGRGLNAEMLALMDDRPVLVILKKKLANPCQTDGHVPEEWAIDVCSLKQLMETELYKAYEWWPKGNGVNN